MKLILPLGLVFVSGLAQAEIYTHCSITTGDGDAVPTQVVATQDIADSHEETLIYGKTSYRIYMNGNRVAISGEDVGSNSFVAGQNEVEFYDGKIGGLLDCVVKTK